VAAACSRHKFFEEIGSSGTGIFTQSGGTNSVSAIGGNEGLFLGTDVGGTGTYNLSGSGLLSVTYQEVIGSSGTGSFTQSGGTNAVSGILVLAQSARSAGTYNLNGGLLSLSGLSQGAGTATFNFSGGTFQAGSSFSTSVPIVLMTSGSNGVFNTNGSTLTLAGNLSGTGKRTMLSPSTTDNGTAGKHRCLWGTVKSARSWRATSRQRAKRPSYVGRCRPGCGAPPHS
jgi:hypothetical protein